MRVLAKTFGWLMVSGLIIFISNISAGVDWKAALVGAAFAKIGTTIAYLFYEVGFEKAWEKQKVADEKIIQFQLDAEAV
jgi:hypothetical protein